MSKQAFDSILEDSFNGGFLKNHYQIQLDLQIYMQLSSFWVNNKAIWVIRTELKLHLRYSTGFWISLGTVEKWAVWSFNKFCLTKAMKDPSDLLSVFQ